MRRPASRVSWNKRRVDLALRPTILVQYKAKTYKIGLRAMILLSPFWVLWLPYLLLWGITRLPLYTDPAIISTIISMFIALPLLVICIAIFLLCVCLRNNFVINSDGIKFPVASLMELKFRRQRSWNELDSIEFVEARNGGQFVSETPNKMNIKFKDAVVLPLSLDSFRKEDMQSLMLAFQSYVPELPMTPSLSEVQLGIDSGSTAQKALSFTQIWEDDMSSRFGSTAFVPLECGNKLLEGRLEVLGQIAFGGLSAIYLVKDRDQKLCVLKEAVIPSSADPESRQKAMEHFSREAKFMMTLKHPRIAGIIDNFVENGHHYLLLEYVDGKDLRKFVKEKGPQRESIVLRWAIEVAEVLDYLHNLDTPIVHRDLTPDNLVLEGDGGVAVIDFGAANEFLGAATGTLIGKQSYMSPEQFRGKACPASDLYSLGATMHFLLTGKDPEALAVSHPAELVSTINPEVDRLVADLTAIDLEKRIGSAKDLITRCRALLNTSKEKVQVEV